MRSLRPTIVAVESSNCYIVWACVCSLNYPAFNANVPYCHLWPVQLYNIFPHYLIICTILEKESYWAWNVCFDFLRTLAKFLILRRIHRDVIASPFGLHAACPLFLSDFSETWSFTTDFLKILKYEISWKSVQWEPSCSVRWDGQTERHNEADSRSLQFCESA